MSLEDSSKRFTGPPSAQPPYSYSPYPYSPYPYSPYPYSPYPYSPYPYSPQDNSHRMTYQVPPSLPPLSSLLSGPAQQQQTYQQPPHSFQPQYNEPRHPLYLSEIHPSAPVHHIYHAPQENAHVTHHRAEPVLVPIMPANPPSARPARVPIPPLPQRRQSKKISQRRDERQKDCVEINRSSAPGQGRANEPDRPSGSRPQDRLPIVQKQRKNKSHEPSTHRETSPSRNAPPAAIPISNLLGCNPDQRPLSTSTYTMTVRQQPIAARACGFGERDRRVIDPPPILQLVISDPTLTREQINARLRQPFHVVHCTLWDPATDRDATHMPGATEKRQQRRLMGTLVSSPFVGRDEFDVEGCFFTFPDLSVRTPGVYSLMFGLAVLDPALFGLPGSKGVIKHVVKSVPFRVFSAKDFIGMRASTALTKQLKCQGHQIAVKKGNSKTNAIDEGDVEDFEEDEEDEEDDMTKPPPAKRNKQR